MRFPKSKLADTIVVLVVAAVILAGFTAARADHGKNGGSGNQGGSTSGSGGGGNDQGGGDHGGNGGNGGNSGGGATSGGGGNNSGGGNSGNGGGDNSLASLKTLPIPATDFSAYLNPGADARNAAIALGKALFWDMQSGGDGQQACASCHFNAGADSRTKGQLNPGPAGAWQVLGGGAAANYIPSASEYPLHHLANLSNRNSQLISDTPNLTGSQGLHHTRFVDVFPGSSVDVGTVITQAAAPDVFGVADLNDRTVKVNTRRTTGKNAPSVINAVYNFRNFWDGRAQNIFNGVNPAGANDASAFVLAADPATGLLLTSNGQTAHQTVRIANAALASQSVGPPNNPVEMSYDGRDFKKLGKKMLSLPPLANQLVATDDSVLGTLSNQSLAPGIPGIGASYQALIQEAFQPRWWNSDQLVDAKGNFVRDAQGGIKSGPPTTTDEFTLAEFNFSLFWGIAIQMYESTLVANDSRFDRFMDGDRTALNSQEQKGLDIFRGKGHCADCHMGATLTDASVSNQGIARSGRAGNPFPGFHMIGVRPSAEEPIIVGGAAKTPSLRNVELTPPYFHNGSQLTLEQVVMFYSRGGDFGARGVDQDEEIEPRGFSLDDMQALVAFLKSLTDPRVANQSAPFDHPSLDIPNGALGNDFSVTQDGAGNALDDPDTMVHVQAVGVNGATPLLTFTAGLQGTPIGFGSISGTGGGGSGSGSGSGSGGGSGNGGGSSGNGGGSSGNDGGGSSATSGNGGGSSTTPTTPSSPATPAAAPSSGSATASAPGNPIVAVPGFTVTAPPVLPTVLDTATTSNVTASPTIANAANVPAASNSAGAGTALGVPNPPAAATPATSDTTPPAAGNSTTPDANTDANANPADDATTADDAPPDSSASDPDSRAGAKDKSDARPKVKKGDGGARPTAAASPAPAAPASSSIHPAVMKDPLPVPAAAPATGGTSASGASK